ncbi:hypothetical protein MNL09_03090 [Bartonella krasnovii]|nr:hypothetical protein MNL09_03090 [Bartonella krasnovii]
MDKDFENNERSASSFSVRRIVVILGVIFIFVFLFTVGILDFLSTKLSAKGCGGIFLILATIGVATLILSGMGILRYHALWLHEDFDFNILIRAMMQL